MLDSKKNRTFSSIFLAYGNFLNLIQVKQILASNYLYISLLIK